MAICWERAILQPFCLCWFYLMSPVVFVFPFRMVSGTGYRSSIVLGLAHCGRMKCKWAASWQNQQCGCSPSEYSDQPGHPPSLIRVFAVRMKKALILSYPLSAQRRLWSDWAESSLGAQPHCWFCHEAAQIRNFHIICKIATEFVISLKVDSGRKQ